MSKPSKQLKLVVKLVVKNGGEIHSIYDDALVSLFAEAKSVSRERASHVEPFRQTRWMVDLRPIGGPMVGNFKTRKQALDAEVRYINRHVIK